LSGHADSLNKLFREKLELPNAAVIWLLDLFEAIQTFDDYADEDKVDRARLDNLIFITLVGMPSNPFYAKHIYELSPVLTLAIMKWKASDTMEKSGRANESSFSWRASYYDVVLAVVSIVHGHLVAMNISQDVLSFYGEKYSDYAKEFKCQIQ
jgi:hypothetical protein